MKLKHKYRIIENQTESVVVAQVRRWYWPFWCNLVGYTTLYSARDKALRWCNEAIEKHKNGKSLKEPEWKVIQ